MKLHSLLVRTCVLFSLPLLFVEAPPAAAQSNAQAASQSLSAQTPAVPARITQAIDERQLVRFEGNVHPLARAEFDQGLVADSTPMNRMLLLLQRSPEQEAALQRLMNEQLSKDSPNFHKWLTPQQFGAQFGPADADIQTVTDWLTRQGFHDLKVGAGRTTIEFSGNVGQVRNAFHTEIHQLSVNGENHVANMSDPQIPAALAPAVAGVVSLHNFRHRSHTRLLGTFRRDTATGVAKPLFTYTDSNGQFFGVGPADFEKIYNVPATVGGNPAGQGVTIAIVGRTNINIQDVRDFRTMFGLPANDPTIVLNGPDPGIISPAEETEADLDVEWAGALAPNAAIQFVVTETPQSNVSDGVDLSGLYIVDNNLAPVMSMSFGTCEPFLGVTGNQFENNLWEQAAAEGITVTVATGDNGSADCDPAAPPATQNAATLGVAVSGVASTPFNIAVGGTDFDNSLAGYPAPYWNVTNTTTTTPPAIPSSAQSYIPEVPWNDSCASAGSVTGCATVNSMGLDLVAGSGGPSSCSSQNGSGVCVGGYAKPAWQVGRTLADNVRDIPDVSLFASDGNHKSFYIICQSDQDPAGGSGCNLTTSATSANQDFQAVGGTSAPTPSFAAIMALVIQQTGQRQGNANPVLYALAAMAGNTCPSNAATASNPGTCVFYDIAKSNDSVACQGGTPNCSNANASQFGIEVTTTGGTTPAFNAGAGYDLATGLGSVNVGNMLTKWSTATATLTPTVTTLQSVTPTAITHGQSVTVNVQVTGTTTPTGDVSLIAAVASPVGIGPFALNGTGTASFATNLLPGGTYNVTAHYAGDGVHAATDSAAPGIQVTVAKESSQTVVRFITFDANGNPIFNTGAMSVPYGSPYILRVDVRNSAGAQCSPDVNQPTAQPTAPCPTGTVNLTDAGNPLKDFSGGTSGSTTLNGQGYLEDQPIQLAVSATAHSLAAAYLGDNSFSASNSSPLAITITQAATATAVAATPTSIASGGSVTLTATVSTISSGVGPTGTVQFKNGGNALGSAATCTPTAASSTTPAFCTATLTTTLAFLVPPSGPNRIPTLRVPWILVMVVALLVLLLLNMKRVPARYRRVYAGAGLLLLAGLLAGLAAGCGSGSGGGGGGGVHSDSITGAYSGDANYAGSTSPVITITVQ